MIDAPLDVFPQARSRLCHVRGQPAVTRPGARGRRGTAGGRSALQSPSINTQPGPEYADGTRAFQGIPGIQRAANGRLWALWYAGGQGEGGANYVLLVGSGDDGRTWSGPRLVIDPPGLGACLRPVPVA